jgi:hypothetical protein
MTGSGVGVSLWVGPGVEVGNPVWVGSGVEVSTWVGSSVSVGVSV